MQMPQSKVATRLSTCEQRLTAYDATTIMHCKLILAQRVGHDTAVFKGQEEGAISRRQTGLTQHI